MSVKIWSGIGARKTPIELHPFVTEVADLFARSGWTMRSGGADGFDSWCEAATPPEQREVHLPWQDYNDNPSPLFGVDDQALALAETMHPAWSQCSLHARKLHARNCYEILGRELNAPSRVVITWTPRGELVGGTATALRLAVLHGVETINLGAPWMTLERAWFLVLQIAKGSTS